MTSITDIVIECLTHVIGTSTLKVDQNVDSIQTTLYYAGDKIGVARFPYGGSEDVNYNIRPEQLYDNAELILKLSGHSLCSLDRAFNPPKKSVCLDLITRNETILVPSSSGSLVSSTSPSKKLDACYRAKFNNCWDGSFFNAMPDQEIIFHDLIIPITASIYDNLLGLIDERAMVFTVDMYLPDEK